MVTRGGTCTLAPLPLSFPEDPPLAENTPDPISPELAPFVAHARADLEQATEGLEAHEAIAHLEATMVRAEVEASRLGFRFPPPELELEQGTPGDGTSPVVVIQRLAEPEG
ncbi:MAG TPA: hypothetical protein VIL48_16610 [Acidimicrobiales bacterium]